MGFGSCLSNMDPISTKLKSSYMDIKKKMVHLKREILHDINLI
jgi:hypothetical protein